MTEKTPKIVIRGHYVTCYSSREACEAQIDYIENEPYLLRTGEESRPILSAHSVSRDRRTLWYIYAVYNYKPDIDLFREDGPFEIIIPHESDKELSIRYKRSHK